jgi:DNA-binding CsgD family transcriptional regulator
LYERIATAETFLELATIVCRDVAEVCHLALHECDGRPIVVVDNATEISDERRLEWVDGTTWQADPLLAALHAHRSPVSDGHTVLLPLVAPNRLIGSLRCRPAIPIAAPHLAVLCADLSVRFAELGIAIDGPPLSPRQNEVARLATRGLTNREIADALAMSENTVKTRLREIFARLDVTNRTELVSAPRMIADIPIGVTHIGALAITRGRQRATVAPWVKPLPTRTRHRRRG